MNLNTLEEMMISDVLFEAGEKIKNYLESEPCPYGERGEPMREQIEKLLQHMQAVRLAPGMDMPPVDESEDSND